MCTRQTSGQPTQVGKSMNRNLLAIFFVIGCLAAIPVHINAAEPNVPHQDVKLSPDVLNLLRAEMSEIAKGVQGIALSIATADWASIQETSAKIRASYIMEKKLTSTQAKELEQVLPEHFKQLDTEFHHRAEKLGVAAAAHDAELVAFHYSRLIYNCILCHSAYAKTRFPGFSMPVHQDHHH